jgi:hypothetical protein
MDAAHSQEPLQLQREDRGLVEVIAYASAVPTCQGIAVISPGAGGTEKGYRYLAEAMSTLGYLSVVVGHQESGRRALREHIRGNGLREGGAELITDPDAYLGRFMDIAAAKRWAETRCPARTSVLIGHSMGAATVMIEAGARNKVGVQGTVFQRLHCPIATRRRFDLPRERVVGHPKPRIADYGHPRYRVGWCLLGNAHRTVQKHAAWVQVRISAIVTGASGIVTEKKSIRSKACRLRLKD